MNKISGISISTFILTNYFSPSLSLSLSLSLKDASSSPSTSTYIIVGDNVDKTVSPRDMRVDNQVQSLHYFQSYAALV